MNLDSQQHILRNICKDITSLTSINSVFLDPEGKTSTEFYYLMPPTILHAYFESLPNTFYPLHKIRSEFESYTVSNAYDMRFIVTPVTYHSIFLGSLLVGPFLMKSSDSNHLQNLLFQRSIPKTLHHVFKQYYSSIEILSTGTISTIMKCILRMLSALDKSSDEYQVNISYDYDENYSSLAEDNEPDFDTYHHLHVLEKRYESENQLYHAVEIGDYKTASSVIFDNQIMFKLLERVPNNPLRSHKNLFFVQNTLLRKAAEKGGVHPIYTDSVSGKYAILIERVQQISEFSQLYSKMIYEYCELVNKHSVSQYSPFVGKAIEYVRLNLDRPLQLSEIAKMLNTSLATASRKFKAETGEAFSDYINRLRMEEALRLMEHKKYSLTQIALKIGYNDVNYFTKIFKKIYHCTPTEYMKRWE